MKKIWTNIKNYFKKPINIAMALLAIAFVVLCFIPIQSVFYTKLKVWVLAVIIGVIAYKILLVYKAKKQLYDASSLTQQEPNSVMERIGNKFDGFDCKNYLIYSIVLFILAVVLIVYTFVK